MMRLMLLCVLSTSEAFRQQSVAVKGKLMCGNMPGANIKVKLMDKDLGADPDDEMAHGYTDEHGEFALAGEATELTNIDPELKIYHHCNGGINPCPRKWVIRIPDNYISSGRTPKKTFDLGTVNLEVELDGETFDCIH